MRKRRRTGSGWVEACAWGAGRRTSSMIAHAAESGRPCPPYSAGISAPRKPLAVSSRTNSVG